MISNGIDLVEIARIEKSIKNQKFLSTVYGVDELEQLKQRGVESYAGAFAAKEAFSKAMGTGVSGFLWNEVQVLHNENAAPYFELSGKAKQLCEQKKLKLALSITHTGEYAAAVVTAYTEE